MPAWGPIAPPARPRRPWWPWLLAAVAVLLVAALVALFLWPRGSGGTPATSGAHPTEPIGTPSATSSTAALPADATTKPITEINLPDELAGWQRLSSEPPRGTVVRADRYGRDGATLTVAAVREDTLAHATAGLVDPIDGETFRCSSVQPQRCWAQARDGVVSLSTPAGVDAVPLMELLVGQL